MKVLQLTSLKCGGAETVLMNYHKNIDTSLVQFDYLVFSDSEDFYDKDALALGANIFRVSGKHRFAQGFRILKKLSKSKEYSAIEIHTENAHSVIWVLLSYLAGFKKVIVHSHSTKNIKMFQHRVSKLFLNLFPIIRFSCGKQATSFMFGKRKAFVVNNAIDLDRYSFDSKKRAAIRNDLNLKEDTIVLGHVGRFIELKNHSLLFEVCKSLEEKGVKYKLLLLGDGELFDLKKEEAKKIGIENNVIFLGNVNNVGDYLQGMDVFLLPSYYEGFPTVAVEAQAAGLRCLLSDTITKDVNITGNVDFISIKEPGELWAKAICDKGLSVRDNWCKVLTEKGLNIKEEAKKIEQVYLTIGRKNGKNIKNIYNSDRHY